jgi:hypothetical protein
MTYQVEKPKRVERTVIVQPQEDSLSVAGGVMLVLLLVLSCLVIAFAMNLGNIRGINDNMPAVQTTAPVAPPVQPVAPIVIQGTPGPAGAPGPQGPPGPVISNPVAPPAPATPAAPAVSSPSSDTSSTSSASGTSTNTGGSEPQSDNSF